MKISPTESEFYLAISNCLDRLSGDWKLLEHRIEELNCQQYYELQVNQFQMRFVRDRGWNKSHSDSFSFRPQGLDQQMDFPKFMQFLQQDGMSDEIDVILEQISRNFKVIERCAAKPIFDEINLLYSRWDKVIADCPGRYLDSKEVVKYMDLGGKEIGLPDSNSEIRQESLLHNEYSIIAVDALKSTGFLPAPGRANESEFIGNNLSLKLMNKESLLYLRFNKPFKPEYVSVQRIASDLFIEYTHKGIYAELQFICTFSAALAKMTSVMNSNVTLKALEEVKSIREKAELLLEI